MQNNLYVSLVIILVLCLAISLAVKPNNKSKKDLSSVYTDKRSFFHAMHTYYYEPLTPSPWVIATSATPSEDLVILYLPDKSPSDNSYSPL